MCAQCGSERKAVQAHGSQKEGEVFEVRNTLILNLSILAFLEKSSWAPCGSYSF